jgi:membrane protein YdbS with pleckstrin-like domain
MSQEENMSEHQAVVGDESARSASAPVEATEPGSAETQPEAPRLELPAVGEWKRVSPKYVVVEVVGTLLFGLVACGAAAVLWLVAGQQWAIYPGVVIAVVVLVMVVLEPRRVRSIGYQLRDDDLVFRRGIMFQRFVAVPYGRMQLVDITRGPVARWLGLADLKFVTAAAATGVAIPGLPADEADLLRDRLVELAESRRAGL